MKKAIAYPFSIVYYLCFGSALVFFHGIQIFCYRVLGYQAHKTSVDTLNWVLLRCLNILGIRFQLSDRPQLNREQPYIIVANHQSTYDIPPLIWFLRSCHPKFISKKELGKGIPSISYNLTHGGSVLIDRKQKTKALEAIKKFAQRVVKHNWSVVIFAEGTRSRDGQPKAFQKGGLLTLFEHIPNAKILPVSIGNSWQLSRYRYFPMPLGVRLCFQFHPLVSIDTERPEKTIEQLEKIIHKGVHQIQSSK
ncbi:MAG: lysophospholipid acyltransferase family protein [Flavobacteriaceae bacterium]